MILQWILVLTTAVLVHSGQIVHAPSGTFQGTFWKTKHDITHNAFLGIPYAKPPVGERRFKPPEMIPPLGVYDATEFKAFCIQINLLPPMHGLGPGEEDCLYLNIFSPESADAAAGDLKSVFVFFHGGGNFNGQANIYNPGQLVTTQDIIVVTVGYRLGYLGFLSTLSPGCEGNFGLKDQILSVAWVKENIQAFGGDPGSITIGGESAGAIDVSFLTIASGTRNLFARAFSMSGLTGVQHPFIVRNAKSTAIKVGRQAECLKEGQPDPTSDEDFDRLVQCLREVPATVFGIEYTPAVPELGPVEYGDLFPKKIEDLFNDESYLHSLNFFERDYLIGFDYNEGDIFTVMNNEVEKSLPEDVRKNLPPNGMFRGTVTHFLSSKFGPVSETVVSNVIDYYSSSYEVSPLADFAADAIFHIPTFEWASAATRGLAMEDSKVHMFRFVHWPKFMAGPYKGMIHGTDLLYLFDLDPDFLKKIIDLHINGSLWGEEDDYLKEKYISMVADFIKTGNPGLSVDPELPTPWLPFDQQEGHYLQFGITPELKTQFKPERLFFWATQIPEWIEEYPVDQTTHTEL
ncbi:carboxylesterase 1C-like isoform X2 [Physella acuta]|uniref:carboxylesterase 1C-like isoform X2 n=1 Tax=Physella acuta TaxID=109671 RepID=UPI0027DCE9D4|nr:carboxylesterase 1C-like isoform X2 [Physella acuta]